MAKRQDKTSLSIRLTESVVFLRSNDPTGRHQPQDDAAPAMIRGLLTLNVAKPIRISSIELELLGTATTSWPEGVGTRRVEVTETHKVFSASTVFFRAHSTPSTRRTASIGPGLSPWHDPEDEYSLSSHIGPSRPQTEAEGNTADKNSFNSRANNQARTSRRVSADNSILHREVLSHVENIPSPPYTLTAGPSLVSDNRPELSYSHDRSSSTSSLPQPPSPGYKAGESAAHTLEELRQALRNESAKRSPSNRPQGRVVSSPASSMLSFHDTSLSRVPSIEDEVMTHAPTHTSSLAVTATPSILSPTLSLNGSDRRDQSRGRKQSVSRFSLAAVSNVFLDAVKDRVRSSSPRTHLAVNRSDRSMDRDKERGRTLDKGKGKAYEQPKERPTLGRKVGEMLGFDGDDHKDSGEGWKEFKKGTYTYPISFAIPSNAPPTLECEYGSMTWQLKAEVHRPGAFRSKLTASREVTVVSCPGEEDTEDTENIFIERQWESQLQYLISVSGRSFHIGGTMPIQITILPLAKVKIHKISVHLEERVDYYTQMKRIARSQAVQRVTLLSLTGPPKGISSETDPILPLVSDDPDAFRRSPFYGLLRRNDNSSEMASSLMGPGPWTFGHELRLPNSCSSLHFTNRNRKSNITIGHVLKVTFRVERGDDNAIDGKTGKRKLFDIVVQTPVHVLSCRCNPDWVSLPRYSEVLERTHTTNNSSCPCMGSPPANERERHTSPLDRASSRYSSDSSTADHQAPVNPSSLRVTSGDTDNLVNRNIQYERLISGQESEMGEAPPSYENATICLTRGRRE